MKLVTYTEAAEFAERAEPVLRNFEDVFSLFYGVLEGIKAGRYEDPFMAVVEEKGEVAALLQMTPPYPLNLILVDEARKDAILETAARQLVLDAVEFSSVISVKDWAISFAEEWKRVTGRGFAVEIDEGVYRLDEVDPELVHSAGDWRRAEEADAPLIAEWFVLFEEEAKLPQTPKEQVREQVASFIGGREVFVWENEGKVVSMMKKARPTAHGVTVSMVFTPKEERRKGYGRTMVAKVTEELLKEFDFCVLFTDLGNATANKIYQEIGYRQIANFAVVEIADR